MAKAKFSTRLVAYAALMTALTYVGTLLGFSSSAFYFNLGDSVILICAYLLGPIPAMLAGGLGSFLADLTVYPATMLYTLFIKAIEGLVAGLLFMLVKKLCAALLSRHENSVDESDRSKNDGDGAQNGENGAENIVGDEENAEYRAKIAAKGTSSASDSMHDCDKDLSQNAENDARSDDKYLQTLPPIAAEDEKSESNNGQGAQINGGNDAQEAKREKTKRIALCCALSLAVCLFSSGLMATGYFVCQTFLYGTYASALIALPLDAVQASVSSVVATAAIGAFCAKKK